MRRELLSSLRMRPKAAYDDLSGLLSEFDVARLAFRDLVESHPVEGDLQRFLEEHPVLLLHAMLDGFYPVASDRSALFAKVRLGSEFETDFLYCSGNSLGTYWTFVEIEPSHAPLFTKAGDPSARLSHALRQVHEWQAWLTDHSEYALNTLYGLIKSTGMNWSWPRYFRRPCQSVVIIGRRQSLTEQTNRLWAQLCASHGSLEIITYDRLCDSYNIDKDEHLDAGKDRVRPVRDFLESPKDG